MDSSTTAAVASVVVASIATCGTVVAALIAHRAEKNTRPISNGFAQHTADALEDQTARLARIEGLIIGHLEDHSRHDLLRRRRQ